MFSAGNRDCVGTAGADFLQRLGFATDDGNLASVDDKMFAAWRAVAGDANPHHLISIRRVVGQLVDEILYRSTFPDGQHRSLISPLGAPARQMPSPHRSAQYKPENPSGKSHREIASRYLELDKQFGQSDGPKSPKGSRHYPPVLLDAPTDVPWRPTTKSC